MRKYNGAERSQAQKEAKVYVRTTAQKAAIALKRKPDNLTRDQKDSNNKRRFPQGVASGNQRMQQLEETYEQGGSADALNKFYAGCHSLKGIEQQRERQKVLHPELQEKRQEREEERQSREAELQEKRQEREEERQSNKDEKQRKRAENWADSTCCGYPRDNIGSAGKTKNDKFHERHHITFKQHPLEGELYEKAKVDAAEAALFLSWFDPTFDEKSIPPF
jgi:hypothetical protein